MWRILKINLLGSNEKMKKFVLSAVVAGSLLSGFGVNNASAANNSAADDYIIINKTYNKLAFYQDKKLVDVFSVATGRTKTLTPEGKFKIAQKIVNRPYWTTGIPGGDPRNPLGNRWLGISVPGRSNAALWGSEYAIHGNNNPSSIGTYASSGCIRMHDSEIEKELYPKVLMNTPVYITSSYKSFAALTNDLGYIPAKSVAVSATTQQTVIGTHVGAIDGSSFEVKTSLGTKVFRTTSSWYINNLVEGKKYRYFYTTNKYGQNIISKVNAY
jgi:hypothetical protein